jgi:hypothetical protein
MALFPASFLAAKRKQTPNPFKSLADQVNQPTPLNVLLVRGCGCVVSGASITAGVLLLLS